MSKLLNHWQTVVATARKSAFEMWLSCEREDVGAVE
jgi:hypothetical protein